MPDQEEFVFFWGGPFSQWAKSPFVIDGVSYNCAEQYMMSEKARLFGDEESRAAIMKADHPREQQALGQKVKNFSADQWNAAAREIVFKGNYAKFSQSSEMLAELRLTGTKTLVEASPIDFIWGIGLAEDDPRARDRSQWKGTNWLGEAISRVRAQLRSEGKL